MEQSVLALLQNHVLTPTSNFETFHCFETREKNIKFLSGCLGYQEFWFHNSIFLGVRNIEYPPVLFWESEILNALLCSWGIRNSESSLVLFGGSEILNLLCCFGDQKFWISCVVWGIRNSESSPVLFGGSETLNPLLCFGGIRSSESSPVLFWGSEILNRLLCFGGIRSSESSPVLFGGSEILSPLLCFGGIRSSKSSPVLFGGSEILNPLLCCLGIRNSESSPVLFLGDQKFWISLLCCLGGSEILNALLCFCRGWELVIVNFRLSSLGIKKLESSPVFYGRVVTWYIRDPLIPIFLPLFWSLSPIFPKILIPEPW